MKLLTSRDHYYNDDEDNDGELFLWYGWPTKGVALFQARTTVRDPHHRESPTRREQQILQQQLQTPQDHIHQHPASCIGTVSNAPTTIYQQQYISWQQPVHQTLQHFPLYQQNTQDLLPAMWRNVNTHNHTCSNVLKWYGCLQLYENMLDTHHLILLHYYLF